MPFSYAKFPTKLPSLAKIIFLQNIFLEVGLYGDHTNIYHLSNKRASNVISNNIQFCKILGIETRQEHMSLPLMYWISKRRYTHF